MGARGDLARERERPRRRARLAGGHLEAHMQRVPNAYATSAELIKRPWFCAGDRDASSEPSADVGRRRPTSGGAGGDRGFTLERGSRGSKMQATMQQMSSQSS